MGRNRFFLVLLALASIPTCLTRTAEASDSPWPAFRHDAAHTGRSAYQGPTNGIVYWHCALNGSGLASPAVASGRIYAVGGGKLSAVALDGQVLWSANCGSVGASSPAVATDGTVYLASTDANLYAFNPNGTLKWKRSIPGSSECSPTVGPDGTVYAGCSASRFVAYRADGTPKYSYTTGGAVASSAARAADGTTYFGCDDGSLYALKADGTLKWKFTPSPTGAVKSSPSVGTDGTIYFGSMNGFFYAVWPGGTQRWRYSAGGAVYSSPAIAPDGSICFGSRDRGVHCVTPTGALRWKVTTGQYVDSSPAIDAAGQVYIGSNDGSVYSIGPSGTVAWSVHVGTAVSSSPAIDDSGAVYVETQDGTLCSLKGDTTPPSTPVVTDDGAYSTSPNTLRATWTCQDAESGIARYDYAIGTSPGASDLVGFTSAGTASAVTRTDLQLVNGVDYYFSVRATNGAGMVSETGVSDGIRVDYTPPAGPVVNDDGDFTSASDSLHALYSAGDPESGVEHYEYSVGSGAGLTDVLGWRSAGQTRDLTIGELSLTHAAMYFINIRAFNQAGLWSEGHSNGITVDLTLPSVESVEVHASLQEIRARVTGADPESGIDTAQCALLTSPDLPPSANWISAPANSDVVIPGPLDAHTVYYVASRVQNRAGLLSKATVTGPVHLDSTAPTMPVVTDDGAYWTDNTTLHASWTCTDAESGIDHYLYCVGTSPGSNNTVDWTQVSQNSVTVTGLNLTAGVKYYFTVRGVNGAGLTSGNGSSNGITIDPTPPSNPVVTDDGDITSVADCLHVVAACADSESGISGYAYCVGTSPGGADVVGWTTVGNQPSITVCGLRLETGEQYYFAVKATNGAGLQSGQGVSDGIEYRPGSAVWRKFRADSRNTGRAVGALPLTATPRWKVQTAGYVESSAAIGGDGTIYVGSSDGKLYAINAAGAVRWAYQIGSPIDASPALAADGSIYVGTYNGLYCLSQAGALRWRLPMSGMIWSSPAIGQDGTIYFGCQNGVFYAVNPDGTVKWTYTTGSEVWSSPAISADGSIYFACGDGKLYALASTGALKWTFATGSAADSSPAIGDDGTIYFGSGDGYLYAVTPQGTQRWRAGFGLVVDSSAAVTEDGRIYVGAGGAGSSGALYALTTAGAEIWHVTLSEGVRSSPAVDGAGNICVGSANGKIYVFGRDGHEVWSCVAGGAILSSPAVGGDGTLVVGSDDGGVYCFRDRQSLDATPPTVPVVSAQHEFISPDAPIAASWSATDPESGIQSYSYAIGTQPGGEEVVGWTDVGASTGMSRSNLPLLPGRSYYVSVTALNYASLRSTAGVSRAITVVSGEQAGRIGWVKKRPTGTQVNLPGKIVTAVFDDCIFIEEPDRSAGIRCVVASSGVQAGSVVNVQGVVDSRYGEIVLTSPVVTPAGFPGAVQPIGIACELLVRVGLDTTGLLLRVSGRVTRVGTGYFIIYDGSRLQSPRGAQGIEVRLASGQSSPAVGDQVCVTTIACKELVNSQITFVLRAVPGVAVGAYAR